MVKNIQHLQGVQKCRPCNMNGFFCYTPSGADYNTCPSCGRNDFLNFESRCTDQYDFLFLDDAYEEDNRYKYQYCQLCKIMFEVGCMHAAQGCTDNVYNAHFIKQWKFDKEYCSKQNLDNVIYEGMPQFEDVDEWFNIANNIEILEMYCPHDGNHCLKGYYKNPEKRCRLLPLYVLK